MNQWRRGEREAREVAERSAREQRETVAGGDQREQPADVGAVVVQRGAEAVGAGDRRELVERRADRRRVDPAGVDEVLEPHRAAEARRRVGRGRRPLRGRRARQRVIARDRDRQRLLVELGDAQPGLREPQRVVDRRDAVDEAGVELSRATPRAIASREATRTVTVSAGATSAAAKPAASGVVPIRSASGGPAATRATSARAASRRSRIGSACSSRRAPASVGSTGRRVSKVAPRSASRTAMCCETADCV